MNETRRLGRIKLLARPDHIGNNVLSIQAGWNDQCPWKDNELNYSELRDLCYLLTRALEYLEREQERRK